MSHRPSCVPRLAAALVTLAVVLLAPATAQGARNLDLGFGDGLFLQPAHSDTWFTNAAAANASWVRILVSWRSVAPEKPLDPRSPTDPAYLFDGIDNAVAGAKAKDLDVMLSVYNAPDWAEGSNRPSTSKIAPGAWKPKRGALADFAHALATRYQGDVHLYQAWNEPNLKDFLSPQFKRGKPVSPRYYVKLLNRFYEAVKDVDQANQVMIGSTSPFGQFRRNGKQISMTPLGFWRKVFCLRGRKALKPARRCRPKPKFDIFGHHPLNPYGPPRQSAVHPDNVTAADLPKIARVLRKAVRARHVKPRGRKPFWVEELWWRSNPPNTINGVSLRKQALYYEEAFYLAWKAGVRRIALHQIRDEPFLKSNGPRQYQTGVYFHPEEGCAKPSLKAFKFPFVTERANRKKIVVWGKAPEAGTLKIQKRAGGNWNTLKKLQLGKPKVFRTPVGLRGKGKLRGVVGVETSLTWRQKR